MDSSSRGADEIRIPLTSGIVGYVAMSKEIVNVKDAYRDDRFNKSVDLRTGYRTKSILCAPIIDGASKSIVGVVQLVNKVDAAEFSEEDETVIASFAAQLSIAILNSLKFEATRKGMQDALASVSALGTKLTAAEQSIKNTRSAERLARQRMLGVLKSSKVLSAHHDLRELFGVVMHEATDLFDAQRATLFLVDERANELWSLVAGGTTDEIRFPMGSGILDMLLPPE